MSIPFTNETLVTVPNPFAPGPVSAVVLDDDGVRLWTGEDYSDPDFVSVSFGRATTGTIELIGGSGGGGGSVADDILEPAFIGAPAGAVIG